MKRVVFLALLLAGTSGFTFSSVWAAPKPFHLKLPQFARPGDRVDMMVPTPRPARKSETVDQPMDLSHALPGKALAGLPSSAQQLKTLSGELKQGQPQLASARTHSESLTREAQDMRHKLIDTAARIENLEQGQIADGVEIDRLKSEDDRLSTGFVNDRVAVTRLLAILERLQHDMPPALAMRPDDALSAARGAMLIGSGLPPVYAQAAHLARRIEALKRTRAALESRRAQAMQTSRDLTAARAELDRLLEAKELEADTAAQTYGTLKTRLEAVARQAADFQALLTRVKTLRQQAGADTAQGVVTVNAQNGDSFGGLAKGTMPEPVVGSLVAGGSQGDAPGLTYATRPGAVVIVPADGKVLYAGPYHKAGQVLILEITTGYDLVLAGMGRVTAKPNDELLAGEPVGSMPALEGPDNRLYFELRRGGKSLNPAPWLKLKLRPVL